MSLYRLLSKFAAAALVAVSVLTISLPANAVANAVEVFLFRGIAGVPFSVGLDDLEEKLKASGIRAQTYPYGKWQQVYNDIIRRGVKEVAFVGHSMGTISSISLTEKLRGSGVNVVYMGLIDIPGPRQSAPVNAAWAEAYVSAQPGFSLLKRDPNASNLVINTRVPSTVHITIDDSDRVHDAIISAVWLAEATSNRQPSSLRAYAPSGRNAGNSTIIQRINNLDATAAPRR